MASNTDPEFPFEKILQISKSALTNSYSPYSKFSVAATLFTEDGKMFTGVNVENASFGLTMCAERTAIGAAVSHGYRKFKAIMVVTGSKGEEYIGPCGACRQVLAEFGTDWDVYICNKENKYRKCTVSELLPHAFTPDSLKGS
ncbi:hypothetical protein JTE90_023029 [Oedothorax gibbosus]|uniref:Cytidine deaminase n=1 Tax=Oedothorax gibbosus TaxID=931172 RepID=A0AAV6V149_9ARAC|nr:hypothetical protein JTE90_023029 [Oedothorax gibbosus]